MPDTRARALFETTYGYAPSQVDIAPGRVNLIGEHTDYNGGLVLPMALPQRTAAALTVNRAGRFRAVSEQLNGAASFAVDGPVSSPVTFYDYLRGACMALAERGHPVPGIDVAVSSDVPIGSGLSSSAALLVAVLRALRSALVLDHSDFDLAQIAHRAEHSFVGVPVGVMDQMACSLAAPGRALLLNTRTLEYESIVFPSDLELGVIDSGQHHHHASGGYRSRRAECERAAEALGVKLLCELEHVENVEERLQTASLTPALRARVSHVLSENRRVTDAVGALRRRDGEALGRLLSASHASLRDQFAVSTPEIDALVEVATGVRGCLGARMTGGGFGGSIVILTRAGEAARVASETVASFRARVPDLQPQVIVPSPAKRSQA